MITRVRAVVAALALTAGIGVLAQPAAAHAKTDMPTEMSIEGRSAADPRPIVGIQAPTMRVKVNGNERDILTVSFQWAAQNADNSWTHLGVLRQEQLRPGDVAAQQITPALEDNRVYRFRATANEARGSSRPTPWLEFAVDAVGPVNAPGVTSADYGNDSNQIYGSIGRTGDFTFEPAGETDIVGYKWGWNDPPMNDVKPAQPGAPVTVPITPPAPNAADPERGGLMTLFVQSYDTTGRTSPVQLYSFNIGDASAAIGQWNLDDSSGSAIAADATGNGYDATIEGATPGVAGRILDGPAQTAPTATAFDGNDVISVNTPILDAGRSFAAAAWVRPTDLTGTRTILGRQGGFHLEHRDGKLRLVLPGAGAPDQSVDIVEPMALNSWTHVAFVYDSATRAASIYIDGQLRVTADAPAGSLDVPGPIVIGSGWAGDISAVKVWDRVVTASEIEPMSSTLVGRWKLDGDGADALAYGRDATPTDGVTWSDDRDGAARLDGANGLATSGPTIRTDQSYTFAAWVKLDAEGGNGAVVSQRGDNSAAITLGYDAQYQRWALTGRNEAAVTTAHGANPVEIGAWVHLTGVYDSGRGELHLYVNGVHEAVASYRAADNAAGPTDIGMALDNGTLGHGFQGEIDDVRAYQGVLSNQQIRKIAGV